jgi:hypothetical protein
MRLNFRLPQLTLLLGLVSCTAPWGGLVRYSPETAEQSTVVEFYTTVLASLAEQPWPDSMIVQEPGHSPPVNEVTALCGDIDVPKHWADTLKRETKLALSDPGCSNRAESVDLASAAHTLGIVLLQSDTTDWPPNPERSRPPRVQLSGPGFNRDSTIGAINMAVQCGIQCGWTETLLLARRPGKRWRIWYSFTHLIA